jgi:Domain of unknown function (DUF5666)
MNVPSPVLTRRNVLSLAVSTFLVGCGGGGTATDGTAAGPPLGTTAGSGAGTADTPDNGAGTSTTSDTGTQTASAPGTGGTGMTAIGTISGFGSVVINGIRFDDTLAAVRVDGVSAQPTDLRLGMVALAQGVRSTAVTTPLPTAIANQIEVWKTAQGTVSHVANMGTYVQFSVAGLTVQTDVGTVFDGLSSASAVASGQTLAVWALQENTAATRWRATRIALASPSRTVTSGLFVSQGSTGTVNGWLLKSRDASLLAGLQHGQMLRVEGTPNDLGTELQVLSVTRTGLTAYAQQDMELEGVVTTPLTNNRFMLSGVTVDVGALRAATLPAIAVGARLEVKGSLQNGVLTATEIELEDDETLEGVEIEARIERYTSLSDFVLRSQRCDASRVTSIENGTVNDLKVGVKIKVKGFKSGDILMVTELEIED